MFLVFVWLPHQDFDECVHRDNRALLKTSPTAKEGPLAPVPPKAALRFYSNPNMVSHVAVSTH